MVGGTLERIFILDDVSIDNFVGNICSRHFQLQFSSKREKMNEKQWNIEREREGEGENKENLNYGNRFIS